MSVKAMAYAWDTHYKGTKKLLLLAIADHADDSGVCYPGVERLAEKATVLRRRAQRLLSELEAEGEIVVDVNRGVHTGAGYTNRYYMARYRSSIGLDTPRLETRSKQMQGVSETTPQGCRTQHPSNQQGVSHTTPLKSTRGVPYNTPGVSETTSLGVSETTPKPSGEPSVEPSESITSNDVAQALGISLDQFASGLDALLPTMRQVARVRLRFRIAILIELLIHVLAIQAEQERAAAIPSIIKAWLESTGAVDPHAYAKTGYRDYAGALHDAGITPDDVRDYVTALKQEDFWQDKTPGWQQIARNIATWKQNRPAPAFVPDPGPELTPVENPSRPEYPYSTLTEEQHQQMDAIYASLGITPEPS